MLASFFQGIVRRLKSLRISTPFKEKRAMTTEATVPRSWDEECSTYDAPYETHEVVLRAREKGLPWAQAEDDYKDKSKLFPSVEAYRFDEDGYPLNPSGRTMRRGRGLLGRWGVNAAIDAVVGCWDSEKTLFDVVLIQRKDNGAWGVPGGMLEGEDVYEEAVREFQEEAAAGQSLEAVKSLLSAERATIMTTLHVNDHRETDNSWIETTPVGFLLTREEMDKLETELQSGDDAANVALVKVDPQQAEPPVHRLNSTHWEIIRAFAASQNQPEGVSAKVIEHQIWCGEEEERL
uniref:Nudix hydrolase domain-containing protein n=1 Tax=Palpitomonas bilix TaxID=652834 RepID=A0A7S3D2H1_9EUKA|mmetsp:Transcript_17311/g.43153  ORF Transcript_17311/g.43153 Transcript_17311/m.43153 type:complete len:292 (+) Transcript_17311:201-1076(+)